MTAYETIRRLATMVVLTGLLVLAAAPAGAQSSDDTRGWERTSVVTGQPSSSQVTQSSVPVERHGWEATSNATATTSRDTVSTSPAPETGPISLTVLYVAGLLVAALIAIGLAWLRPHRRPHKVA